MSRSFLALAAVVLLASPAVAACGDDAAAGTVTRTVTDEVTATERETVTSTVRAEAAGDVDDNVEVRTPAPDRATATVTRTTTDVTTRVEDPCREVPEVEDGTYAVDEAGTVEIRRVAGVLLLGEVDPAEGWTYEVTDDDRDRIEVEFRGDGRQDLGLKLRVDDGELRGLLCTGDG